MADGGRPESASDDREEDAQFFLNFINEHAGGQYEELCANAGAETAPGAGVGNSAGTMELRAGASPGTQAGPMVPASMAPTGSLSVETDLEKLRFTTSGYLKFFFL